VANTLAYYNTTTITAVKSFIVHSPGVLNSSIPLKIVFYGLRGNKDEMTKFLTLATSFSLKEFDRKSQLTIERWNVVQ